MCTINRDDIIYGSWNIRCNRHKYLSFWTIFCPSSPLTTQKIKTLKLKKKMEILSFYTCVPQITVIWCVVPEIWNLTDITFNVILDHFLPFYPPRHPENQNFEKMKTPPEDIIILQICNINDSHMKYSSWGMECNGQNFLSSWTVFCPFTALKTWKIEILKKWK